MDPITQQTARSAAGAGADRIYVDDVFSTFLYDGNGGTQSINNGIDLSGEGGLVWIKDRDQSGSAHGLFDTERGAPKTIYSSSDTREWTSSGTQDLYQFNNNGFSVGTNYNVYVNSSNNSMVSWTFRKCPGFFDIVTYTGTGSARYVSHNLGSAPGAIFIKKTSGAENWAVYHRERGAGKYGELNTNSQFYSNSNRFNNTSPSSTSFMVGTSHTVNENGATYVAYLFAHDDQQFGEDGNQSIIKCGGYTGNGGSQTINVGFEPQFLIIKRTSGGNDWFMFDTVRGHFVEPGDSKILRCNQAYGESNYSNAYVDSTGFRWTMSDSEFNMNSQAYIYIAIRRPHKPAENANDVFDAFTDIGYNGSRIIEGSKDNFLDFQISKSTGSTYNWYWLDRMQGSRHLSSNTESGNSTTQSSVASFDAMTGMRTDASDGFTNQSPWGGPYTRYHFKRAPKFFTIRPYTGNGVNGTSVSHDLGVVPELMIVKKRDAGDPWLIYHKDMGASKESYFSNSAFVTGNDVWYDTPTSTQFYMNNHDTINRNTNWMIAYLFASCPGISKVGSYTGTGNTIDIDCGFTNGARFVMIKRTDASADWFVMSHNMGINTGNDPYLNFNANGPQGTTVDIINPLSSGFQVRTAGGAAINTSGGNYIYLAIA